MFKNVKKEEVIIPAQMSYLRQVRDFIDQIGRKYRYNHKIINSFKLVVDEACTNIIRHGYRDIKNGQIAVRAIIRRLSLTIVIVDNGKSFDPRQVQNPDLNKYINIGKKGGLGIFMMRKLMDDIKYNVTERGNELRLTKMREKVERAKPLTIWDSFSLRTKFTLVTSAILTILAVVSFLIFNSRIRENITDDVYTKGQAASANLAQISWEPINEEKNITLFENAKSIKESNPQLVQTVLITNVNQVPLATYPVNMDLVDQQLNIENKTILDTLNRTTIYRYRFAQDSLVNAFVTPIVLEGSESGLLGFAHIWTSNSYIEHKIQSSRLNLILLLIILLIVGYAGSFVLISFIMDPFHKLAGWVREVGHGTADEDELDIDAGDELGEIASAFNEMTSKFREAQVGLMEQQRMQRELQVAQEIQQMLLPDDFPNVLGYDITSYYQAAKEVGGDLFDFVEVDDHTIGICVADVSGKGVPGSMVMTMIRTALRLEARGNNNPADVLSKVNRFITDDIRKGMFVTAFYLILDSRERMISFASAGHNPMVLYRGKSRETYYLNPSGFPIGISLPDISLFDRTIKQDRIRLHPDDILVAYTDGITEAMNYERNLYGEERFLSAIREFGQLDVVDFVTNVKENILGFAGGFEQNDDITLVAIKENMEAVDVKIEMFMELFEMAGKSDVTVADACKKMRVSPSTYYKYKKIYEEEGYDYLREMLHGYTNVGLRHLSIEVKTKLYEIIRQHPEYGPKRISDALDTEEYGYMKVHHRLIYEELQRAKLNRRQQRQIFVQRGGKRRLKPPGTPLLTLDGEVMVGFRSDEEEKIPKAFAVSTPGANIKSREKLLTHKGKDKQQNNDEVDAEEENVDIEQEEETQEENKKQVEEESEFSDGGSSNKNEEKTSEEDDNSDNSESVQEEIEKKER